MEKTLEIFYPGGSGGFFTLWVILLASKYRCKWPAEFDQYELDDIFHYQWNIDLNYWKKTEIWPDNNRTKSSDLQQKIYFHCNPSSNDIKDKEKNVIRIVPYTDLQTHFKLMQFKKCNFHLRFNNLEKFKLDSLILVYKKLKDESWIDIKNFNDFSKLTPWQIDELDKVFNFKILKTLDETYEEHFNFKLNNDKIWDEYKELIETADIAVKWQDIIKTDGEVLLSPLGLSANQKVKNFIKHYVDQHPIEIKNFLFNK